MRILFLSRWFPNPPDNGSKTRIFNLIKYLSQRHEVDLLSFASEALTDEHMAAMRHCCRRVQVIPYRPFQPYRLKAVLSFLSPRPRSVVDTHSLEMQRLVEESNRTRPFDVVIASQIEMAPYVTRLCSQPKVLEEVELTAIYEQHIRQRNPLRRVRSQMTWWKLSHYLSKIAPAFDGCTVVSEHEQDLILRILPTFQPICIVPNGVDLARHTVDFGHPQIDTLIYSGALTYQANFDAVDFFLRDIFPLIRAQRPGVKFFITGKIDGVPVKRLPRLPGVSFTGYLQDVRPILANSWASVVPLRVGGGTRLKILESLAMGTPVIATSKGAEGLGLVHGQDILVADTPSEFAQATVRLLRDADLRVMLSRNGRFAVETRYDWTRIGQQFVRFIEEVVAQRQRRQSNEAI